MRTSPVRSIPVSARADSRTEQTAIPPGEQGSAYDDRGDDLQLQPRAAQRIDAFETRDLDNPGEGGEESGNDETDHAHAIDMNTLQARRLGVAPVAKTALPKRV